MTWGTDQQYLRTRQYHNAANLSARASLHERFSTNPTGWHAWVFDHLTLPSSARVLELGGGPGWLWANNVERIPPGWQVTLSDFSPGMVQEAQLNLRDHIERFGFEVIDAQAIPYDNATFDAVVANHMLYHVPNRAAAIAEIHRVLKPGGLLIAATNGANHLRQIRELVLGFDPQAQVIHGFGVGLDFTLENGRDQLARAFADIKLRLYEDALVVTEVAPLVAYILSSPARPASIEARLADFTQYLQNEMTPTGAITITKDTGLFIARRD